VRRPRDHKPEDAWSEALLQTESLVIGVLLLIMTAAFSLKALLF
jgi:hypothetical protein